ncbi:hypothetical protein U1Q18_001460 [Sarracenia purpurea var. burkii]
MVLLQQLLVSHARVTAFLCFSFRRQLSALFGCLCKAIISLVLKLVSVAVVGLSLSLQNLIPDSKALSLTSWKSSLQSPCSLVKVARSGDRVIALHVLNPNTGEGKSTLLSLVKTFDSMLAAYDGFCNLKQVPISNFAILFSFCLFFPKSNSRLVPDKILENLSKYDLNGLDSERIQKYQI